MTNYIRTTRVDERWTQRTDGRKNDLEMSGNTEQGQVLKDKTFRMPINNRKDREETQTP